MRLSELTNDVMRVIVTEAINASFDLGDTQAKFAERFVNRLDDIEAEEKAQKGTGI